MQLAAPGCARSRTRAETFFARFRSSSSSSPTSSSVASRSSCSRCSAAASSPASMAAPRAAALPRCRAAGPAGPALGREDLRVHRFTMPSRPGRLPSWTLALNRFDGVHEL